MIRSNNFSSKISSFKLVCFIVFYLIFLIPTVLVAANPEKPDFWIRNDAGSITHT